MSELSEAPSPVGQKEALRYSALVVSAYVAVIAAAEAIMALQGVLVGVALDALIILALTSNYLFVKTAAYRRVLPALALAPLLRILSFTMPIRQVPQIFWYVMIGVPLLVAVGLTIRLLGLSREQLGLKFPIRPSQLGIGLSGLLVGLPAYLILRPNPLTVHFELGSALLGSIILAIFSGFTEEIIFRGVLQQTAAEVFGIAAIFISTVLFAVMYIGTLSLGYMMWMGLVGLYFGWAVHRTGSIWGVILAHSLLNISLLFIWPYIL